jgi:hypothetical protein
MPSATTIFVVTDDESGSGLPVVIQRVIAP